MSQTRPTHYTRHGVEPIDAIEDWGLGFALGNTVKYISRAGRKVGQSTESDLRKALWYLAYAIGGKATADRAVAALETPQEESTGQADGPSQAVAEQVEAKPATWIATSSSVPSDGKNHVLLSGQWVALCGVASKAWRPSPEGVGVTCEACAKYAQFIEPEAQP